MPPLAAVFVAFLAVAVPVILLMTVWATVTALRLLFPETSRPADPPSAAQLMGEGVPVRVQDIVASERARRARAERAPADREQAPSGPRPHPLFEDLWLRRN